MEVGVGGDDDADVVAAASRRRDYGGDDGGGDGYMKWTHRGRDSGVGSQSLCRSLEP